MGSYGNEKVRQTCGMQRQPIRKNSMRIKHLVTDICRDQPAAFAVTDKAR